MSLNAVPQEPSLRDLLDLTKKELMLALSCHHVGTVQSFNAAAMTVTATVNYTKTFYQRNTSGLYVPVLVNYPTLVDCPIICLGGGKTNLTFPIAKGDECLLLFNDRDIDNWYSSGQVGQGCATNRLHSFSDAFALVGVKSTPNLLSGYDAVRALITNGNAKVGINPSNGKLTLQNSGTTLNTLLQSVITNIKNLITQVAAITVTPGSLAGPSSPPLNVAAINALTSNLTTLGTQIGGLIE